MFIEADYAPKSIFRRKFTSITMIYTNVYKYLRVFDGLTAASRKALAGFDLAPQASSPLQPAIATRVQPAPTIE